MTITRDKLNAEIAIMLIKMNLGVKKLTSVNIFDEAVASSLKARINKDMSYRKSFAKIEKNKPKPKPLTF